MISGTELAALPRCGRCGRLPAVADRHGATACTRALDLRSLWPHGERLLAAENVGNRWIIQPQVPAICQRSPLLGDEVQIVLA